MVQLFIANNTGINDWVELELSDDTQLQLNFIRNDVNDIQNRNTSFSQSIELPGTTKNRLSFQHIYNLDLIVNTLQRVYINKKFKCEYYIDDIPFKGILELESISLDNETTNVVFECSIRGNSIQIKDKIGDKLLVGNIERDDDLDFSEYIHEFNNTNIRNSWNTQTDAGAGYFYPVMNLTNSKTQTYQKESLRPALYAKEVLDKIFDKAGLTYESPFLEGSEFRTMVHPWVGKTETPQDVLTSREFRAGLSSNTSDGNNLGWDTRKTSEYRLLLPNDNDTGLDFFDNGGNYTNKYNVPANGMYRFNFTGQFIPVLNSFYSNGLKLIDSGSYSEIQVQIVINRASTKQVGPFTLPIPYTALSSTTIKWEPVKGAKFLVNNTATDEWTFAPVTATTQTSQEQLTEGEKVYVIVNFNNNVNFIDSGGKSIPGSSLKYRSLKSSNGFPTTVFANQAIKSNKIFLGEQMSPGQGLPENVKQYDYFKSILNLFNLIISEDPDDDNNFIIDTYDNVIGSGDTYDWDYKVNNDELIDVRRVPTLIDKNAYFKYKKDSDFYQNDYDEFFGETFGNYRKLNIEETIEDYPISVLFSQTPHYYNDNDTVIIPHLYKLDKNDLFLAGKAFNMRIMYRVDTETDLSFSSQNFKNYTNNREFRISLKGDTQGPNVGTQTITNVPYILNRYISSVSKLVTCSHFQDPYSPLSNDLNFGFQKTYYAKLPGNTGYPTPNNLYNRFWSNYIENIIDINSKIITVEVKLSAKEIYELTFDDIINYDGHQWIINRINNWTNNKLTEVELLRLKLEED